jgi:hypothetical protein
MKTQRNLKQSPRKDTGAWILLTWAAFMTAVGISVFGLLATPGEFWTKGYLFMGLAFVLSSTFTLSKTLRDNQFDKVDTGQWLMQVWVAFLLSSGLALMGVMNLPGEPIYKGFGLMSLIFSVTSSFTLAKTIRDNQEANQFDLADRNHDGLLSAAELEGSVFASRMKTQDRNGDGQLSRAEALKG